MIINSNSNTITKFLELTLFLFGKSIFSTGAQWFFPAVGCGFFFFFPLEWLMALVTSYLVGFCFSSSSSPSSTSSFPSPSSFSSSSSPSSPSSPFLPFSSFLSPQLCSNLFKSKDSVLILWAAVLRSYSRDQGGILSRTTGGCEGLGPRIGADVVFCDKKTKKQEPWWHGKILS